MRTSLNINIPEPCHEDWSKMTLQEKGRHCTSCEKTVFDFTHSTDEQIVKTFLEEGKVCGRFKSTQLNRELVLSRKEKNNYLSYVASTLFAFLSFGNQDVEAQGKSRIVNVDSLQTATVNGKFGTSILNVKPVYGTIFSSDKFPIPNAVITIKGNGISTISNEDGSFVIKVTLETILLIKAAGYETTEITIRDFGKRQIYLKTNSVIASTIESQSNYKTTNDRLKKGNIVSKIDGLPLPGVSVTNLHTKIKTQSDFDGNFSIIAIKGDTLSFGFVGMKSMKQKLSESNYYSFIMEDDLCQLEMVVLGISTYRSDNYFKKKCKQLKKQAQRIEKLQKIKNGALERTAVGKFLYNITNIFRRKN